MYIKLLCTSHLELPLPGTWHMGDVKCLHFLFTSTAIMAASITSNIESGPKTIKVETDFPAVWWNEHSTRLKAI